MSLITPHLGPAHHIFVLFLQYSTCNVAAMDNKYALLDRFAGCECNHDAETRNTDGSDAITRSACTSLCACLQGFYIPYDAARCLAVTGASGTHHTPLFECHRGCRCDGTCPTRVVQKGIHHQLEVFKTPNKGFGLSTLEPIPRNSFVCEYAGEVLTAGTARVRACGYKVDPSSNFYLFVLNEFLSSNTNNAQLTSQSQNVIRTYIDPSLIGNAARFINHSCDPNLFMVPVRVGCSVPSLALFALRDIEKGEELSFNYAGCQGDTSQAETDDVLEARHQDVMSRICYCESENCSGYLPYEETLFVE